VGLACASQGVDAHRPAARHHSKRRLAGNCLDQGCIARQAGSAVEAEGFAARGAAGASQSPGAAL